MSMLQNLFTTRKIQHLQISLWQHVLMSREGNTISVGLCSQHYFKVTEKNYSQEQSFQAETFSRVRQLKTLNAIMVSNYISRERNENAIPKFWVCFFFVFLVLFFFCSVLLFPDSATRPH